MTPPRKIKVLIVDDSASVRQTLTAVLGSDRHPRGDLRRDRGSMGFFVDMHGKDHYPPEFKNDSAWRVYDAKRRGYGYGLDGE